MRELTIVGGGIAGLCLGIGLRNAGVPVTILEAGQYPRHRVCGEFLAGLQPDVLGRLGLENLLSRATVNHSVSWFHRGRKIAGNALPRSVHGYSRFALDAELAEVFAARGGRLKTRARVPVAKGAPLPEGWILCCGKRKRGNEWLGLKCHLFDLPLEDELEMHIGNGGYVGLSRIENDRVNCCGLFRIGRSLPGGRQEVLFAALEVADLGALGARLRAARVDPASFCAVSGFGFGVDSSHPAAGEDSVLLGDAFGMIPPLTGNGMTMAMESAAEALPDLAIYARGGISWREAAESIRGRQRRKFGSRLRTAVWVQMAFNHAPLRATLLGLAKYRLLPFVFLYRLLH